MIKKIECIEIVQSIFSVQGHKRPHSPKGHNNKEIIKSKLGYIIYYYLSFSHWHIIQQFDYIKFNIIIVTPTNMLKVA